MRSIRWYTWIGIVILFLIATAGFIKIFNSINNMAHYDNMNVKVESEEVNHQIQLDIETKEAGDLTSVKSIPFTQVKNIDQTIKKWANEREQSFFTEMKESDLLLDYKTSAHFSLESQIKPIKDNIYNIVITEEQSAEQTSNYKNMKTYTINLDEEEFIHFEDIIKKSLSSNKLFKLLQNNSESNLNEEKFQEKDDFFSNVDWTINKNDIIFYFKAGDLSKQNEKVEVPLMQFYSYLKDDYYEAFITDELDESIKLQQEEERKQKEEERSEKEAQNKEALQSRKMVALTFDDGPDPENTPKILDSLQAYNAKATFFNLANNAEQNPDIVQRITNEGHEIGNHSISHANLNAVKRQKAEQEIINSKQMIEDVTGEEITLFRPPYGNFEDDTQKMINDSNQDIIMWSLDTKDWDSKNTNEIYQTVKNNVEPGSIILMHDIHEVTADALPKILSYLDNEGYELVTVSELQPYIEGTNNGAYFGY